MTRNEILGGLAGVALATLGFFVGAVVLGRSAAPGLAYFLAISFAFGLGWGGARARRGRTD